MNGRVPSPEMQREKNPGDHRKQERSALRPSPFPPLSCYGEKDCYAEKRKSKAPGGNRERIGVGKADQWSREGNPQQRNRENEPGTQGGALPDITHKKRAGASASAPAKPLLARGCSQ